MRMEIDQLRPLTAGKLLQLRHDPLLDQCTPEEAGLVGNALVVAACCLREGQVVFQNGQEVLEQLTAEEIEGFIRAIAAGETRPPQQTHAAENAGFDLSRFSRMCREEAL